MKRKHQAERTTLIKHRSQMQRPCMGGHITSRQTKITFYAHVWPLIVFSSHLMKHLSSCTVC